MYEYHTDRNFKCGWCLACTANENWAGRIWNLYYAAVGLCIFAGIADNLSLILEITGLMKEILGENGIYVEVLIKMLGITYVAEFSAGICRDAGYQTVAAQIEIFAKIMILALSMPILLALLKTIRTFLV